MERQVPWMHPCPSFDPPELAQEWCRMGPANRARRITLLVVGGVSAALLLGYTVHAFDLAHLDPVTLADRLRASGPMGPLLLFVLLVVQAVVAPIPAPPIL